MWCVEVPNGLDSMRFSPVLLAAIAASATLGLTHPAEAETSNLEPSSVDRQVDSVNGSEIAVTEADLLPQDDRTDSQPLMEALSDADLSADLSAVDGIETPSVEFLAQDFDAPEPDGDGCCP